MLNRDGHSPLTRCSLTSEHSCNVHRHFTDAGKSYQIVAGFWLLLCSYEGEEVKSRPT
jgi:hypothetical protein